MANYREVTRSAGRSLRPTTMLYETFDAILGIAIRGGTKRPVSSHDIAALVGIRRRYIEATFQHLTRAGLLISHRGPNGGYMLGREPSQISVGDIVRAIREFEGNAEHPSVSRASIEIAQPLWRQVQSDMFTYLDNMTLERLCHRARAMGIAA